MYEFFFLLAKAQFYADQAVSVDRLFWDVSQPHYLQGVRSEATMMLAAEN